MAKGKSKDEKTANKTAKKRSKWIRKGSELLIKAGVVAGVITADQMAEILDKGIGHIMVGPRGSSNIQEYKRIRGQQPDDSK